MGKQLISYRLRGKKINAIDIEQKMIEAAKRKAIELVEESDKVLTFG